MLKLICARKALVMRMRLAISWDPRGSDDEIELLNFQLIINKIHYKTQKVPDLKVFG